ncbi:MAG: DedA family protein [Acidimicrobiales bacterium]
MQHWISSGGYAIVFLLMVAESACVPFPSEVIMLFAGVLAFDGRLNLVGVIVLGIAGNVVGSLIAWAVGWAGGRPALQRWGRFVFLSEAELDRSERWFERHGEGAVFFGRMLPVVRTFISLPAGVARMAPGRFTLFTLAGCIPWTAALGVAGYEIGSQWHGVAHGFHDATYVLAVLAVLLVLGIAFGVLRRRRGARTPSTSAT